MAGFKNGKSLGMDMGDTARQLQAANAAPDPEPESEPEPDAINDDDDETSNFLVAYRVWSLDPNDTWDVNAGITLWNLRHPKTRIVAEDWLKRSLSHPKDVLLKNDDQYYLQRSLQKVTTATTTRSTTAGSRVKETALVGLTSKRTSRTMYLSREESGFLLEKAERLILKPRAEMELPQVCIM